jgi:hypothetical protein
MLGLCYQVTVAKILAGNKDGPASGCQPRVDLEASCRNSEIEEQEQAWMMLMRSADTDKESDQVRVKERTSAEQHLGSEHQSGTRMPCHGSGESSSSTTAGPDRQKTHM